MQLCCTNLEIKITQQSNYNKSYLINCYDSPANSVLCESWLWISWIPCESIMEMFT